MQTEIVRRMIARVFIVLSYVVPVEIHGLRNLPSVTLARSPAPRGLETEQNSPYDMVYCNIRL